MNVSDAVSQRKSIRNFLDTPIDNNQLQKLLELAARAPSGGNLQPWHVYVLNGQRMVDFQSHLDTNNAREQPAYDIYPANLGEPYRSRRFKVGEDMYALLGIPREDKPARFAHLARNFAFFGAPAGFFCYVDKTMGPPQWSDLGMFLQTFMLLAQEAGLATCAQEAWATRPEAVSSFVNAPREQMLFCGMAVGYANPEASVNNLVSDRGPFAEWGQFV